MTGTVETQAGEAAAAQAEDVLEGVGETATGAESEGSEDLEQEDKPAKTFTQEELDAKLAKSRNRFERRHSREIGELKAELAKLATAQKENGEKPTAGSAKAESPKRTDFDTYEDYLEARTHYTAGETIRKELETLRSEREKETTERKTSDTQKQLAEMANARIQEGRKEYADFDSVLQDAFEDGIIKDGSELHYGIIESSVGHRIAYYLGQNPDEAERINKLSVRGVHRELGKLEDKFSKKSDGKKQPTMETLNGSQRIPKPNDPMRENLSMDDFVRIRNSQDQKRRGF